MTAPCRWAATALAVVLLSSGPAPAGDKTEASTLSGRTERLLEEVREKHDLPGITVGYVLADGTVGEAASGLSDREANRPMTPDTPMLAASIGKTFVGATVLALASDGLLDLDDPLSDHLGDRDWFGRLPNADAITLRHLLRHEAGLPDHVHLPAFQEVAAARFAPDQEPFAPEELIGFVLDQAPSFAAGEGWAYSDTGYVLLGLVIEAVTGRDYYDVVRERFIGPLGLDDTVPSNRPDIANLAVGYTPPDNPFGLPPRTANADGHLVWNPASEWTGGGYASTARDLAVWGDALFAGHALATPYLDALLDGIPVDPGTTSIRYGTGVAIYAETQRGPVHGHGGWIPGYVSSLRHYADHDVTVAFMISTDVGADDAVAALEGALADLAIGADE